MIYTAVTMVCLTASLGLSSCSDDEFLYRDQARVRLVGPENYTAGSDSLTFSFATSSSDVEEKVMNVEVVVMGLAADHDRTASVTADENKTTASSSLYDFPKSVVIEAGKTSAILPVTLRRASSLESQKVQLYLKVEASDDFAVGVNEENHLLLIWSDMISKPTN